MEDRILINGVWYIKENTNKSIKHSEHYQKVTEENVCHTFCILWETSNWCFLAETFSLLSDENQEPWIKITDKRLGEKEYWVEEVIDNPTWMIGIYEENPKNLEEARETMDEEGILKLFSFIEYLIKKGWINYPKIKQ